MKRNITINFHGILYSIDEDAYQLLNNYIENIKRYFSKKEDGDEIANDIECRISELLAARTGSTPVPSTEKRSCYGFSFFCCVRMCRWRGTYVPLQE